jgi:hypothetical protein
MGFHSGFLNVPMRNGIARAKRGAIGKTAGRSGNRRGAGAECGERPAGTNWLDGGNYFG